MNAPARQDLGRRLSAAPEGLGPPGRALGRRQVEVSVRAATPLPAVWALARAQVPFAITEAGGRGTQRRRRGHRARAPSTHA